MRKLERAFQVGRTFGVGHGVLRLGYEFERGSGLLARRMRSAEGWHSWDLKRIAPHFSSEMLLHLRRDGTRSFFFRDARTLGAALKEMLDRNEHKSILSEAELILAGHLPFFGNLSYLCGVPPRWFENPVTGQAVSPRQSWTQMRFASPVYGDLKFILEPSRFLFAYALVRAYALTGDERFPEAFWQFVEDWAAHSPPMNGPLWICGQECSLRILAWSFALHGFVHSPSTTPERVTLLFSMIASHAWRTAQTVAYARSQRSNHLISEAVGLWTAGTLYPELSAATRWRNLGAQILRQSVVDQITTEGVSHQHSFNYHRMILHLLLWALRLSEIRGDGLHEDVRSRAQLAFDFLRSWVDPVSGRFPNYGSNDGSQILPLAVNDYSDCRPLLQLGAAVLDRPALPSGSWNEPALWFGLEPAASTSAPAPQSFPEAGYFRLGDEDSWALIRAGSFQRRPFQCDQLHVDLWWRGLNVARDAGTYLYNGPAPWNNAFAGAAVHNTVTVDGRDQMTRAGRFLWLDWAQASGRVFDPENSTRAVAFEGEHSGYRKLGITHRRRVERLAGVGWLIIDELIGSGDHKLRLHWLTPDLPYEFRASPFEVAFTYGQSEICWNFFAGTPSEGAVVRAGTLIEASPNFQANDCDTALLGYEAPTYGDLRSAVSLLYQTRCQLPVRFVTLVRMGKRHELGSMNLDATWVERKLETV